MSSFRPFSWCRWFRGDNRRSGGITVVVLIAGLVVPSFAAGAQSPVAVTVVEDTSDRIVIEYVLGPFTSEAVLIDGARYTQISLGSEASMKIKGAPALPHVYRSVIIPDEAAMAVNVLTSRYYDVSDILVAPSKGIISRQINPEDVPYEFGDVYKVDAFLPARVATLGEAYILRDHRGTVVQLHPFQYNPVTKTLRVYTEVTLEVVQVGPGTVNVLHRQGTEEEKSLAFHQVYEHHFLNYSPSTRYTPMDEEGDMLVICHDDWLSNVQPLVDHKNSIGISTTAVGVSTIPGGTSSSAIAAYIQDVYDSSDLAFVLLVGDAAQVDTPYASGGSSDPSYSKVAGGDDYPDIMVGRFSAETPADVDTQVERTIEYENMPATEQDWFWKGTGIASSQGAGIGDEGQSDIEHENEIRDWLMGDGWTEVDQIYDPSATSAQVAAALNSGRGIVNYTGHGSTTSWGSSGFSNSDVNALVNDNMLPFICSVACVNGQFDGYTCFAEAWLRATNGSEPTGAVGAYMSSINQSWAPPMEGQDEFNILLTDPSEPYHSYGTLCYAGSCSMMDDYGSGGVEMFNTWILFGDPSLRVVGVAYQPPVEISLPDGAPDFLDPGVETTILVQIEDAREVYVPGSGTLHYRYDGGDFLTSPLTPLRSGLYEATLPQTLCSDTPEFYFSAMGDEGGTMYHPGDEEGPAPLTAIVATVTVVLNDDFETDQGWTVENLDLLAGGWERGIPAGDGTRGDPVTDFDGSGQCYLTGNLEGNSDVDGGPTRLISPTLDLAGAGDAVLSYAYWFTCDDDLPPAEDFLELEVSTDDGGSWTLIETISSAEGWVEATVDIKGAIAPAPLTAQMKIRFSVTDNPNDSKTEAGIDAVEILRLVCAQPGDGDFDGDGDVDMIDVARFADCLAGPDVTPGPPDPFRAEDCLAGFDFDVDADVDLSDFGSFQGVFADAQ